MENTVKKQKTLHYILQACYGHGYEDLISTDCGLKQKNHTKALQEIKAYKKDYLNNDRSFSKIRIIKRYE